VVFKSFSLTEITGVLVLIIRGWLYVVSALFLISTCLIDGLIFTSLVYTNLVPTKRVVNVIKKKSG
jgi:hypothetical protein